jgi:putative thioredoxin
MRSRGYGDIAPLRTRARLGSMTDPRLQASSIFTRGAVDLSALRTPAPAAAPAPAPAQPAPPTPTAPGGTGGTGGGVSIIDVTEATFQSEVLERSLQTPVIIDFWAEWCGPCKQLSPILEKLAIEGNGAWVLARIDVDANPRLAQMFRVQGIPMVFAVVGGQPVDAFTGVVPEAQLRPWIDAVLKAGGVAVETPSDPRLDTADDALMAGDLDAAEQAYKKILAESPADAAAEAGLAQVELLRRVQGKDPAAVLAAAGAAPDDVAAQTLAADVEMLSGQAENAYQRLVDLVRRSAGADREAARLHLVSLFTVAGPDDPAVSAARRQLASALF